MILFNGRCEEGNDPGKKQVNRSHRRRLDVHGAEDGEKEKRGAQSVAAVIKELAQRSAHGELSRVLAVDGVELRVRENERSRNKMNPRRHVLVKRKVVSKHQSGRPERAKKRNEGDHVRCHRPWNKLDEPVPERGQHVVKRRIPRRRVLVLLEKIGVPLRDAEH
eukprot:Amastigsp_a681645_33.p2 type:complete len:164 gc:universal Amastigsp_a681645_33:531-40(-)